MDKKFLGQRIKEARTDREYSIEDLAQAIGLNKSTISRYERGEIESPKMPVIESIANELHVNPAWLVGKSEDKSYTPPMGTPLFYVNNIFKPLKSIRLALRLSPEDVAYAVGISREDYLKIEGGYNTDCITAIHIADFLNVPLEYALSPHGVLGEDSMLVFLETKVSRLRQAFYALSDFGRDSVIDFAENLINKEGLATSCPAQSVEDEIEAEVAEYRRQLLDEKEAAAKSSVSTSSSEKLA